MIKTMKNKVQEKKLLMELQQKSKKLNKNKKRGVAKKKYIE